MMRDRLNALTSVRFFAALWVIAFHQSGTNGWLFGAISSAPSPVFNAVRTGYSAVGMFFVLSGFILAYTYSKPELNTRSFFTARFARIYPVYLLGLILAFPAVVLPWRHGHSPAPAVALTTLLLPTLLLQAWHPMLALAFNGPGWSLSAEAFFYLMFPLLIPPISGRSKRQLLGGMVIAIALSLIAPMVCVYLNTAWFGRASSISLAGDQLVPNIVQYNPLLRLPDFLFGILTARLFMQVSKSYSSTSEKSASGWKWYLPAMAGLCICCCWYSEHIYHPLFNSTLLPLFGMMIFGLAIGGGLVARILSNRWLVRLGEASYAMYILHSPLVWWTYYMDGRFNLIHSHPVLVFDGYLLVVTAVSLLVYQFVEEPARRYLRQRLSGKPVAANAALQPTAAML